MNRILYAIFALSGAASLAFETLWFRQAGLTFGNSVWASSLVLSSFMAGIALGNGLAAHYADRIARPVAAYALLELVIAVSGIGLVFILPSLTGAIAQLLRPFFDQPWILNPARLGIGFLLLLTPATAMGATLPLVVRALHARDPIFGSVLGRLYGANTLGAMLGAVAGEAFLIEWLGIRGSAIFVGSLGLSAALAALWVSRRLASFSVAGAEANAAGRTLSPSAWRCLVAAFLAGGILLALEVVWFRFLHLFAHGGGLAFSLMLATVLMGIGVGGYVGGWWMRRDPKAFRHASNLAFVSGCVLVSVYLGYGSVLEPYRVQYVRDARDILWLTFGLTFPSSLLSGVLFTWVGAALEREVQPDSRATGLITLSNTFGAGLGSILAGFVLLPQLGMERSFYVLSTLYGLVGLLLSSVEHTSTSARGPISRWLAATAFLVAMLLFPSGLMERDYLRRIVERYRGEMSQVAELREGLLQTIIYLRYELDGELLYHRLITDGYTMSGTSERARRYMRLFVYLPMALHPDAERSLLISYGVGETAKALTETASLRHIDIVDTSRAILDSSGTIHPDPTENPLEDPRVRVHVEDGRYFLRTTREGFDLITGEPPPPKIAGVVSLYTREYFQLVYERLNEGGVNTYWLPAHNLDEAESKAIIRAYCDVFADCALWSTSNLDWMLTGSKNLESAPSEEAFSRQWRAPVVASRLRAIGVDAPELLGTLFLAGPAQLRAITAETLPLVDDFPKRIGSEVSTRIAERAEIYAPWMESSRARRRFRDSDYIRRVWPPGMRARTLGQFDYQHMLVEALRPFGHSNPLDDLYRVHRVLTETTYRFLAVRLLSHSGDSLDAVRRLVEGGAGEDDYPIPLAVDALASRDFASAVRHLRRSLRRHPRDDGLLFLHLYALCMSGDLDRAEQLVNRASPRLDGSPEGREFRSWLRETFDLGS
jgi:predicted membrane-bound spermidine synthase